MRISGNENRLIKIWVCVTSLSLAHAVTLRDVFHLQFYHMKMRIIISTLAGSHEDVMEIVITPITGFGHRQHSIAIKNIKSRARLLGFKSQPCHLEVLSLGKLLNSLCFSFPFYKIGIKIISTS